MVSELKLTEIQKLLEQNTELGNPKSKGSPFFIFQKNEKRNAKFYGNFNHSNFEITYNSFLDTVPYILEGTFTSENESQTIIDYKIKKMLFPYLLSVIMFIFVHIWAISMIISSESLIIVALFFYLIFSTIFLIKYKRNKIKLKKMETEFKTLLQITE